MTVHFYPHLHNMRSLTLSVIPLAVQYALVDGLDGNEFAPFARFYTVR